MCRHITTVRFNSIAERKLHLNKRMQLLIINPSQTRTWVMGYMRAEVWIKEIDMCVCVCVSIYKLYIIIALLYYLSQR